MAQEGLTEQENEAVVLTWEEGGPSPPHPQQCHVQAFLVSTAGATPGISRAEASDANEHPTMHRAAHTENYPAPYEKYGG